MKWVQGPIPESEQRGVVAVIRGPKSRAEWFAWDNLGPHNVSARWFPHTPTEEQQRKLPPLPKADGFHWARAEP